MVTRDCWGDVLVSAFYSSYDEDVAMAITMIFNQPALWSLVLPSPLRPLTVQREWHRGGWSFICLSDPTQWPVVTGQRSSTAADAWFTNPSDVPHIIYNRYRAVLWSLVALKMHDDRTSNCAITCSANLYCRLICF